MYKKGGNQAYGEQYYLNVICKIVRLFFFGATFSGTSPVGQPQVLCRIFPDVRYLMNDGDSFKFENYKEIK